MTVGDILRSSRIASGLSRRQQADTSGVSYMTIKRVEEDSVVPRLDTAIKLAKTTNLSLDVFLGLKS